MFLSELISTINSPISRAILATSALGAALYWLLSDPPVPEGLKNIKSIPSRRIAWMIISGTGFDKQYEITREIIEKAEIVKIWIRGKWAVWVTDPELAKVIVTRPDIFPKILLQDFVPDTLMDRFFGISVVFSNGDVWRHHRKIVNPAFNMVDVGPFNECANELVNYIKAGSLKGSLPVQSLMSRVTLDVLGKAGFSFDFRAVENPKGHFVSVYQSLMDDIEVPHYNLFPFLDRYFRPKSTWRRLKEFEDLVYGIMAEKRKAGIREEDNDLLSRMLKANIGNELTDKELRDNVFVFIVAGHDTTASSLTYLIYQMAINPSVQARARAEALAVFDTAGTTLTLDDQKHLTFITACIKEGLRVSPPVPFLPQRITSAPVNLGGHIIPAQTIVALQFWGLHHNPKYWPNPNTFDPDRFMDKQNADIWLPFGGGPRMCLGMNFSLIEQRIMMAYLLRAFEWKLIEGSMHVDGPKYQGGGFGFLRMKELDIVFKPRE